MSGHEVGMVLVLDDRDVIADSPRLDPSELRCTIYPSSSDTGLAVIATDGGVLLSVAHTVALRDHLNLALAQAGVS